MSLTLSLNTALTGLQASQTLLQVVSANVANANTAGYTRKTADLETQVLPDGTGVGVSITDIRRTVDQYLLAETRSAGSLVGILEVKNQYYERVQYLYGSPDSNLSFGARLNDLGTSLQELAATPESPALQIDTVAFAQSVTRQMNDTSRQLQALRAEADNQITLHVAEINAKLQMIAEINTAIRENLVIDYPVGDLQDKRDLALATISELMDVDSFIRATGEMVVFTTDGTVLVDSAAATLVHDPASSLGPTVSYPGGIGGIDVNGADITSSINGGKIAGLIEVRDTLLPDLQAEIDLLSETLRDVINELHNQGSGLQPANSLTGTRSFADPTTDTISFTSDVRIAVVDDTGAIAAIYDLPAGSYTIQAIETAIDTNLAGFATASTAADGPLTITASTAGYGIAVVDLAANTVTDIDAVTTYNGFSNYFGLNDLFVTTGNSPGDANTGISAIIEVRSDILANASLISRGALDAGTGANAPAVGDVAISPGDASVAQLMADKFLEQLSFVAAGDLGQKTTTLGGYGTEIISANSIQAAAAQSDLEFRRTLHQQLTYRLQSDSGVNVDEELANMVVYQHLYNASARVIATTQELFDILSNLVS